MKSQSCFMTSRGGSSLVATYISYPCRHRYRSVSWPPGRTAFAVAWGEMRTWALSGSGASGPRAPSGHARWLWPRSSLSVINRLGCHRGAAGAGSGRVEFPCLNNRDQRAAHIGELPGERQIRHDCFAASTVSVRRNSINWPPAARAGAGHGARCAKSRAARSARPSNAPAAAQAPPGQRVRPCPAAPAPPGGSR